MGSDWVEQRNFSLFVRKFCDSCEMCWRVVLTVCVDLFVYICPCNGWPGSLAAYGIQL